MQGTKKKVDDITNDPVLYAIYFSISITNINIKQYLYLL